MEFSVTICWDIYGISATRILNIDLLEALLLEPRMVEKRFEVKIQTLLYRSTGAVDLLESSGNTLNLVTKKVNI